MFSAEQILSEGLISTLKDNERPTGHQNVNTLPCRECHVVTPSDRWHGAAPGGAILTVYTE